MDQRVDGHGTPSDMDELPASTSGTIKEAAIEDTNSSSEQVETDKHGKQVLIKEVCDTKSASLFVENSSCQKPQQSFDHKPVAVPEMSHNPYLPTTELPNIPNCIPNPGFPGQTSNLPNPGFPLRTSTPLNPGFPSQTSSLGYVGQTTLHNLCFPGQTSTSLNPGFPGPSMPPLLMLPTAPSSYSSERRRAKKEQEIKDFYQQLAKNMKLKDEYEKKSETVRKLKAYYTHLTKRGSR